MKFSLQLPAVENWKFWIFIALIFRIALFYFCLTEFKDADQHYKGSPMLCTGDTELYLEPIEHLISAGTYADDFRMPGYGFIYFLLRLILNPLVSLYVIGFLQVLLSAISVYCLALICKTILKSRTAFLIAYFLFLASTFTAVYDAFLLTESLCTSFLIFSFYFLTKPSLNRSAIFLAGLFTTWSIFLRPIILPVILIQALYMFFIFRGESIKRQSLNILCFLILFIVAEGSWTIRNALKYQQFIPLTKTGIYHPNTLGTYDYELSLFCRAIGEWEPGVEIDPDLHTSSRFKESNLIAIPIDCYTSKFNADSLRQLIAAKNQMLSENNSREAKAAENELILTKLHSYTNSIKEEKPFEYYFKSRIRAVKRYFFHSGSYKLFGRPFNDLNGFEKTFKVLSSLLYYFVFVVGALGILFLLVTGIKTKNKLSVLMASTAMYLSLVCPLILKLSESRFFVPAYPLFIVGIATIIAQLKTRMDATNQ